MKVYGEIEGILLINLDEWILDCAATCVRHCVCVCNERGKITESNMLSPRKRWKKKRDLHIMFIPIVDWDFMSLNKSNYYNRTCDSGQSLRFC